MGNDHIPFRLRDNDRSHCRTHRPSVGDLERSDSGVPVLWGEEAMKHELSRCLICETQVFGDILNWRRDFDHVDELCEQMYLDDLGYGINGKWR